MSSTVQYPWAAVPHALSDPMSLRTAPCNACLKQIENGRNWTEMKKACISWLGAETGKKDVCSSIGTRQSVCSAAQGTVPHPPATAPP